VVVNGLTFIGVIVILFVYDWRLALLSSPSSHSLPSKPMVPRQLGPRPIAAPASPSPMF